MEKKLSFKAWIGIILVGFVGQLAWAVENNYINLWVFSQTANVSYITWMTSGSAIVAALTSFIMGALSDRLGKRKIFISTGYIVWGFSVILFGVMSYKNLYSLFPLCNTFLLVGIFNVVVDCLMTFFGSTANDACFNAYVTEITTKKNRNLVESVLSILPLFALGAMLLIGGLIGVPGERNNRSTEEFALAISPNWFKFFLVFGLITSLIGIASIILLPKDNSNPEKNRSYLTELIYGFKPSTIKQNSIFYIVLVAFLFFNIAIDSFMPYYLVYFTNDVSIGGLGLGDSYLLIMIIIMGIASLLIIAVGLRLEAIGPLKLLLPAIIFVVIGSLMFLFVQNVILICVAGIIMIFGYLLGTTILGAKLRDETPKNEVGLFQGVRMVATVMLPMVIGSTLGKISFGGASYIDINGNTVFAPTKWMFLVTAIAALIAIVPSLYLIKISKK